MTKAVCIRCGALKGGALGRCADCGHLPRSERDLVNSLALSDRHYDVETLKQIGLDIARGGPLPALSEDHDTAIRGAARGYKERFDPLLDHLDRNPGGGGAATTGDAAKVRARFSDSDWALVRTLPLQVFGFIAGADGKIDREEINDLIDQIAEADRLVSPLHRAIMRSISHEKDFWLVLQHASSYADSMEKVREIKGILNAVLDRDEYNEFMQSLFWSGLEIAQSSGGGPFGISSPLSGAEQRHLDAFAELYDFIPGRMSG